MGYQPEKTLFNGCLSQPAATLPNATMRRDLVQNNWSQSRLLPGLPLVDLEERKPFSAPKPKKKKKEKETHRSTKRKHYTTNHSRLWQQRLEAGRGSEGGCGTSLALCTQFYGMFLSDACVIGISTPLRSM